MRIIPKPQNIETKPGFFRVLEQTKILIYPFSPKLKQTAEFLSKSIKNSSGINIPILPGQSTTTNAIQIKIAETGLGDEGYKLNINARYVEIEAESKRGIFYAIQSILQLFPVEIFGETSGHLELPVCKISDQPRFKWRGMHLDVSRHFFPVSFIKEYIDLLAMHKMNIFHWHLTDDNGWRIEIKKYPRLQEIAAWRAPREGIDWRDCLPQEAGEETSYGGFYTQAEVKDIIAYAAVRAITIVPEIEMPGHSVEVLAAYPHLGCTGGPYTVPTGVYWPNTDIFCAGKEEVFEFLQDVLNEVIELFPSEYLHIGGDEACKTEWKTCPACQARMEEEKLLNVEELQSWFIKRIEIYLKTKNRKLIGWDEILEGGLAPEATVMSWRGETGGIEAAKQGHDVIMCPGTHCYFDHYQADPVTAPAAIGGYTSLKKVYNYEPIPKQLSEAESKHVLGAQANLWTEWVPNKEHAEYMILPRMCALAEVVWSTPESRDWADFYQRSELMKQRFDLLGYNYCEGSFIVDIQHDFEVETKSYRIRLSSELPESEIRYSLDGSDLTAESKLYTESFTIKQDTILQAGIFRNGKLLGTASKREFNCHKAMGKSLITIPELHPSYLPAANLTNGVLGSTKIGAEWSGVQGIDLQIELDLEEIMDVSEISVNTLQSFNSWIFAAEKVEVSVATQKDIYQVICSKENPEYSKVKPTRIDKFNLPINQQIRYLKINFTARKKCPEGHDAAEDDCWLFIDQIVVK